MIKAVMLDLDGTVYRGTEEVPGAADFVRYLRGEGIGVLFVTNRANRTPHVVRDHLVGLGIDCKIEDILTSAQATAAYLEKGSAYYIGEDGLEVALEEQGITTSEEDPDYVVVSFDRGFTYDKMVKACRLIDGGAKFIATNPDKGLRTEEGIYPGTGAIVAAVAAGSGMEPIVIGKPEKLIIEMALKRLGVTPDEAILVGDNVNIDVPAGSNAGVRTALLLTGISSREDAAASGLNPDWVLDGFEELTTVVRALLAD